MLHRVWRRADRLRGRDFFFSDPDGLTRTYYETSTALRADKEQFGSSRRARWFGLKPADKSDPGGGRCGQNFAPPYFDLSGFSASE